MTLAQHEEIERLKTIDIIVSITYDSKLKQFNADVYHFNKKYHSVRNNVLEAIEHALKIAKQIENNLIQNN